MVGILDYIIDENKTFEDWVLGGDSSEQGTENSKYLIYAIIAFPTGMLNSLQTSINKVIEKHIGTTKNCELHAKDIWNASARVKTPFAALFDKQMMKDFFVDTCTAISKFKPIIVASCYPYHPAEKETITKTISGKAGMAYSTLSRLDLNIQIVSGKRIGSSTFFIDPECERMMIHSRKGSKKLDGLLSEVQLHKFEKDNMEFTFSINPTYTPVDSRDNLLVQLADLIAYFVGKHLSLTEVIDLVLESKQEITPKVFQKIEDSNFALSLWHILDIEVVGLYQRQNIMPQWLTRALHAYPDAVKWADSANISIRESIIASKKGEVLMNGTGYYAFLDADRR